MAFLTRNPNHHHLSAPPVSSALHYSRFEVGEAGDNEEREKDAEPRRGVTPVSSEGCVACFHRHCEWLSESFGARSQENCFILQSHQLLLAFLAIRDHATTESSLKSFSEPPKQLVLFQGVKAVRFTDYLFQQARKNLLV